MKKINLGCGPHTIEGWDNLDLESHPGVIVTDLSLGQLPYADNSVDYAFSEHFIEHLTKEQFIPLLKDVHRVLKPGGVFRISTPDLRVIASDYINGKADRWKEVWLPSSPCELLNMGLRLWGHQYVYDKPELFKLAEQAGFVPLRAQHRESMILELENLEKRPYHMDLIVELFKR